MITSEQANGGAVPELKSITEIFENPVADAERMASIIVDLVEEAFRHGDMADVIGKMGTDSYHITSQSKENILWSLYKLEDYIRDIGRAVERATQ